MSSRDGTVYTVSATKEVILSAGAIGSAQLMLLSGIGASSELSKVGIQTNVELKDVGKNLQVCEVPIVCDSLPGIKQYFSYL